MVDLPVSDEEWLARYILRKDHVRQDGTVKPDPFIPHPHADLSVTRHLGLDEREIWGIGTKVAEQVAARPRSATLQGRADAQARLYRRQGLFVESAPVKGNANHANVTGWPPDKPSQKEIALLIAREVAYKPKPQT
ncbi:MAG: hypothetical protein KDJ54_06920 [Candidatus Competibacteraceae bacterium]|nr:hypothetical protein [Candidatus Competibacteraceae bacterium]